MTPIRHWPSIALITLGIGLVTMPHVTAYSGSTFIQGFELLKMCEGINDEGSATNTMAVGCAQFVIGVHDTMSSLTFGDLLDKGFVCFPEEYSGTELSLVVKNYLKANRPRLEEPANVLVAVAFVEKYPCEE